MSEPDGTYSLSGGTPPIPASPAPAAPSTPPAAPPVQGKSPIPPGAPATAAQALAAVRAAHPSGTAAPPQGAGGGGAGGGDLQAVEYLNRAYKQMADQLGKIIVGQSEVIEQVLTAMFCQGHILLVGVPGLAKTLLVRTIADVLHLSFKRVQFTPDLMPSDITGTDVLEEDRTTGRRAFRFVKGPLFANILLADEINRTPPKTQAALLEAMQEHRVTAGDTTYELPEPFFVLATQNPIEQEGTYPLPEAQLDRFMFMTIVRYPTADEEIRIMKQATTSYKGQLSRLLDGAAIMKLQEIVRRVPVAEHVYAYARDLVRATRPGELGTPPFIKDLVQWGAGPRASINLILAGKARAVLNGRVHVTTDDIVKMAHPILRHRILPTFSAEAAGMSSDKIINKLLEEVPRTKG
jgi:MoxR-like ATPase